MTKAQKEYQAGLQKLIQAIMMDIILFGSCEYENAKNYAKLYFPKWKPKGKKKYFAILHRKAKATIDANKRKARKNIQSK